MPTVTEQVNLTAGGPSPVDPPALSKDKSLLRNSAPAESLANGTGIDGAKGKGIATSGPYIVSSTMASVPNGRVSTSSHSVGSGGAAETGSLNANGVPRSRDSQGQGFINGTSARRSAEIVASPASMSAKSRISDAAGATSPTGKNGASSAPVTRHRRAQSASSPASSAAGAVAADPPKPEAYRFSSVSNIENATKSGTPTTPTFGASGLPVLQHRHTLQVPRVSQGRSSRDYSFIGNIGEEGMTTGASHSMGFRRASLNLQRRVTRSMHSDIFLEEVHQDADAAKWAETIRQKRISRRKKQEEEEDDKVMVGTKVDQNHVNWVTAYNMLTGIRFTVSRTNAKLDRGLTPQDFNAKHKFSFDITGNELTPSAKYDFKFKDYAPWVFRHLRAKFHIDPADYLVSLTSKYILSELGSPGKSGSFFYFSRDYKYIIKTIHHAEHKLLRKILHDYYTHIEHNPNTLLSQFYGLHRVKMPYGRKIHFVVMNNLFPPHRDIHSTFDLKGSTIGRDFKEEDLEKNPRATMKDLNWLRRNNHLEFGPVKKKLFVEQMERDVQLLQRLKIMDYSLLVGVHDLARGNALNLRDKTLQVFQPGGDSSDPSQRPLQRTPSKVENARKARELREIIKKEKPIPMEQSALTMPENYGDQKNFAFKSDEGGFRATHENGNPGDEIYYLGIIDCLTHYGFVKRMEHFWKGLSNNKTQISPIPPQQYGDRFVKFISGVTMPEEEADRRQPETSTEVATATAGAATAGPAAADEHAAGPSSTAPNRVVEKAERQARESRSGASDEPPERVLTTSSAQAQTPAPPASAPHQQQEQPGQARSASPEKGAGRPGSVTLPVLEEAAESASQGARSMRSGRSAERSAREGEEAAVEEKIAVQEEEEVVDVTTAAGGLQEGAGARVELEANPIGGRPPPTPPKEPAVAAEVEEGGRAEGEKGRSSMPFLPLPRFSGEMLGFKP